MGPRTTTLSAALEGLTQTQGLHVFVSEPETGMIIEFSGSGFEIQGGLISELRGSSFKP